MPSQVNLNFDWGQESLGARMVGPLLYELQSNSAHVPLARGDVVVVEPASAEIMDIHELADVHIVEVYFKLNCSDATVEEKVREWSRATYVEQTTRLTARLNVASLDWLKDTVETDPKVSMVEVVRAIGGSFSLPEAIADANGADDPSDASSPTERNSGDHMSVDEKASSLARILTTWQLAAQNGLPPVLLVHQLKTIRRVSHELIELLENADSDIRIHVDPRLSDGVAEVLSEFFSDDDSEIPDAPPDWLL